jgi:hypothetical protein
MHCYTCATTTNLIALPMGKHRCKDCNLWMAHVALLNQQYWTLQLPCAQDIEAKLWGIVERNGG